VDVNNYLSTREVAASLRVSYNTVMGWVYGQKIIVVRRGRWWFIHKEEVERMRQARAA
jgi:excisionase family DNA binding protein